MTDRTPTLSPQNLERLRMLERDHERLFSLHRPLTAALTVALAKPIDEVMSRAPEFEPEQEQLSIHAIAETMVRKAYKGSEAAFAQIVDRIEGKPGMRKGEVDEAMDQHRVTVEATIEGVVEAMTKLRIESAHPQDVVPAMIEHEPAAPQSETQTEETRQINDLDSPVDFP